MKRISLLFLCSLPFGFAVASGHYILAAALFGALYAIASPCTDAA